MTLRDRVMESLRAHPGSTSTFLACRLDAPHAAVQLVIEHLVATAAVVLGMPSASVESYLPVYYPAEERIGTCEMCGATDHHLVQGLCPRCRPKTVTIVALEGALDVFAQ